MVTEAFEIAYRRLIRDILDNGEVRKGRNGTTRSLFGRTLVVDLQEGFPLLKGRRIYYKGVLGELAAMLKGPKTIKDFEDQGCNYWKLWGKADGTINVDYGNSWLDYNGFNQHANLIDTLKHNPTDRRMVITGWRPDKLDDLDLPCCHYAYQWYVRDGKYLDMLWHQRSVDTMIGLPSDMVFAAAWNIMIANEVGLVPGKITFTLGDTHIYEEHLMPAREYMGKMIYFEQTDYKLNCPEGTPTVSFTPDMLEIINYTPREPISFKLKA